MQAQPQQVEPARQPEPVAQVRPQQAEPVHQAEPAPWEQPAPQAEAARQPEPQPEPEPQPQPQPQAARTSMSPARIFQALLTEVKREDVATGALLNGVSLVQDGANYYLEFPASAQFAMNIAMKGTAHELILRAFTQIAGPEPQLELRLAGIGSQGGAQPEPSYGGSDFGGYSQPQEDDGYFDALSASAQYYSDEPAGDSYGGGGGSFTGGSAPFTSNDSAPVIDTFAEPNFDDPFAAGAKPIDAETAASLADTLSAFGTGIKLTEVDE